MASRRGWMGPAPGAPPADDIPTPLPPPSASDRAI
jgi:hypothetical protein